MGFGGGVGRSLEVGWGGVWRWGGVGFGGRVKVRVFLCL